MNTNCKNCGAPLSGGKCEYCGTVYGNDPARVVMCGEKVGILVPPSRPNWRDFGEPVLLYHEQGGERIDRR